MGTAVLPPLPTASEVVSTGAYIDTTDNILLQESQTQIPTEVLTIPDIDTLLQDNIIDIDTQNTTITDIGLQGIGTPVVYYPCFQMGASTPKKPKRRPKSSRRSLDIKVETLINQQGISFQRTPQASHTPTPDTAGPLTPEPSAIVLG